MSGYSNNYSDSDDDLSNDNSGGGLRKQLEEALAMNKRLVEKLDGADRAKTVTDLLKDAKLDPAVSGLIPEKTDPKEWLEKNLHLLAPSKGEDLADAPTHEVQVQVPVEEDAAIAAERAALAAMRDAQESGSPSATVTNDLIERIGKTNTEEELLALIQSGGVMAG